MNHILPDCRAGETPYPEDVWQKSDRIWRFFVSENLFISESDFYLREWGEERTERQSRFFLG